MNDRTSAYRCKISPPQSAATLKVGSTTKNVEVIEQSRETFTVLVKNSLAKQISVGKRAKLRFQDMLWSVACRNKWVNEQGLVEIEFECLAELSDPTKSAVTKFNSRSSLISATPSDGTLATVFLTIFFLCVLIMPAWGGRWGVSEVICNSVLSVWKGLVSLFLGREYI